MRTIILVSISLFLLNACSDYNSSNNQEAVAQSGSKLLYANELTLNLNNDISVEDSISIVRNYIDRWIKKELLLSKAEENLTEEFKTEIDKKLEETRANLMIFEYEQQMMFQRMDTIVSIEEINSYYDSNLNNFLLSNDLLKTLFLKVPIEAPNINRVRNWYKSDNQQDMNDLESYAYQFAEKFDDFSEAWINISILSRELPEVIENTNRFLRDRKYYEFSDLEFFYFIEIRDFRLKGAIAPLDYVKNDIRTIILNNRKIEFLQELENGIYNEGLRDNSFKIFN